MERILEDYLEKMEKYLKPVAVSERIDIIKEIKSEMLELQNAGVPAEQIIERLSNPKDLAKAYLGNLLSKESGFSWNRFLTVCAFYSLVGFSGLFIIPSLAIIAPTFIACGIIAPILSAIKMIDYICNLGIPYISNIGIVLSGLVSLNPIIEFAISLFIGVLLYLTGQGAWKLLIFYCKKVSKTKSSLSI